MDLNALGTSAGINIGVCVGVFSLYSILRKQPSQARVYFGRRLSIGARKSNALCLDRFVPSASWIVKAWKTTDEEILNNVGLDSVVFVRIIVFRSVKPFLSFLYKMSCQVYCLIFYMGELCVRHYSCSCC